MGRQNTSDVFPIFIIMIKIRPKTQGIEKSRNTSVVDGVRLNYKTSKSFVGCCILFYLHVATKRLYKTEPKNMT